MSVELENLSNEEVLLIQFLRRVEARISVSKGSTHTTMEIGIPKKSGDIVSSGTGASGITSFNFTRRDEEK